MDTVMVGTCGAKVSIIVILPTPKLASPVEQRYLGWE
jgi:hypothetical protein